MEEQEIIEDEPQFSPPVPAGATNAGAAGSGPTDGLALADEEITINPDSPAFAFAAPPPEAGNPYLAVLHRGAKGLKVVATDDKSAIRYCMNHIAIELLTDKDGKPAAREGSKDNPKGFDQATTLQLGGSNRTADILRAGLRLPLPAKQTHRSTAEALFDALARDPKTRINIQWRARCGNCSVKGGVQYQVQGERNFPQLPDGSRSHIWTCPNCKGEVSANWQPVKYMPA